MLHLPARLRRDAEPQQQHKKNDQSAMHKLSTAGAAARIRHKNLSRFGCLFSRDLNRYSISAPASV